MVTKNKTTLHDKDPETMSKSERAEWERRFVEETIKPRVIGYSDTMNGAKKLIGKKKRCHIETVNGVYLVIQAKAR